MDPLRRQLYEHVADLVCSLSGAQAEALALELEKHATPKKIRNLGGSVAPRAVVELCDLWQRVSVSGEHLADAIRCASRAVRTTSAHEKVELLYTGPGADAIRRTEQGLLEVIRSAQEELWVVSYVVGLGSDDVLGALQERAVAGVDVKLLMDHRPKGANHGLSRLHDEAPGCRVFVWPDEKRALGDGKFANLHAKCAVADCRRAFVSSANLTGWAMDHNLEVGYLVTGGTSPSSLDAYFDMLVEIGEIVPRSD